jgi:hypothetical protein
VLLRGAHSRELITGAAGFCPIYAYRHSSWWLNKQVGQGCPIALVLPFLIVADMFQLVGLLQAKPVIPDHLVNEKVNGRQIGRIRGADIPGQIPSFG